MNYQWKERFNDFHHTHQKYFQYIRKDGESITFYQWTRYPDDYQNCGNRYLEINKNTCTRCTIFSVSYYNKYYKDKNWCKKVQDTVSQYIKLFDQDKLKFMNGGLAIIRSSYQYCPDYVMIEKIIGENQE